VQPAAEAVRGFFLDLAGAPPRRAGKGCLLTNSAVEFGNGDPEISRLVRCAFTRMERVLAERLTEARQDGQLAAGVEPAAYARQLVVLIQGLRVMARESGLYVSGSRGKTSLGIEEPERFSEPGVFLVRPDGTLYWAAVQTMPFARPHFREMLAALDFVAKNDYPARGEA
jgi:hypothetical protein